MFSEGLGDKETRSSQGLSRQLDKRSFQRRFLMFKNKVIRIERVLMVQTRYTRLPTQLETLIKP